MIVSSPSMIRSPARRLILSMPSRSRPARCPRRGCKQRRAEVTAGRLVDHLVGLTGPHQDRRLEIGREVLQHRRGAHGHVHVHRARPFKAEALGVLVDHLDLKPLEEAVRVGHWERQRRVLERLEPQEGRLGVVREQRIALTAESDQALGELENRVRLDLDAPEARTLDRERQSGAYSSRSWCRGSSSATVGRCWRPPAGPRSAPPAGSSS